MQKKNDKGITIIALLITVILLIMLAGVSVNSGYSVLKDVRIGRNISNMAFVRAKVDTIYEQYQFSGKAEELIGTKVDKIDFLSNEEIVLIQQRAGNSEFANWNWYQWDSDTLKSQGLDENMLGENEYFYVNYEYGEIIYNQGISYRTNDMKYYSLTGLNYLYENN